MNPQIPTHSEELFLEITRYLAAVDLYRTEHCEPTWLPESTPLVAPDEGPGTAQAKSAPSAH